MNCSYSKIEDIFKNIVNAYINDGYEPDAATTLKLRLNSVNFATLKKGDQTATVSIKFSQETLPNVSYPLQCRDIVINEHGIDMIVHHFYSIGSCSDYYTTDVYIAYKSRELGIKRYIEYNTRKATYAHIDLSKISDSSKNYITRKIDDYMSNQNRSNRYYIVDFYFSYRGSNRQCIAVIKHDDCKHTESVNLEKLFTKK